MSPCAPVMCEVSDAPDIWLGQIISARYLRRLITAVHYEYRCGA